MNANELMYRYRQVIDEEPMFKSNEIAIIANENAKKDGILLVGMNPSGCGNFMIYPYLECDNNFFNPKHKMMGEFDDRCAYIDLFPFRNGVQGIAADDDECRYRGKLLSHTRDYIEDLRPRLIIYANTSTRYWGFRGDWMGYKFFHIKSPLLGDKQCWPLYKITGIVPTDVNRRSTGSNLENYTYFLRYRQHEDRARRPVPVSKMLTQDDIQLLTSFIDKDWAASLLK